MGAFLAALGAVLLFILRVIGILLLVVLILLVLLLLCPFCADLCWEHGVLTVKAGALGITFPVFQYPKPEPPPAPENPEPPRGFGKVKAKFAAWRAERKRKKAEEKARKKAAAAAAKANKPAQPRKKAKITLEILCTMLKGAGTLTKAVFGALRITKIQVRLGVRGEDPAAAARSYGKLQAWLYPVLGVLVAPRPLPARARRAVPRLRFRRRRPSAPNAVPKSRSWRTRAGPTSASPKNSVPPPPL